MIYFQFMRRGLGLITFIGLLFVFVISTACNDEAGGGSNDGDSSSFDIELLAQAEPDECFCGIGAADNGQISNSSTGDCTDLTPEPPLTQCIPKTNQSYVWSLTKIGNQLWFGTLPNSGCIAGAGVFNQIPFLENDPVTGGLVLACEFGESHVASSKPSPIFGDHRTPRIYTYDTSNANLEERFVDNCEGGTELLETTLGLRAGGSLDNGEAEIVILAGPSFLGGINMFAFDPETHQCIAAKNFKEYNDSRKMLVVNGVLYFGLGKTPDEENPEGGGRILRYIGDSTNPLLWEEVGNLDTIPAFLNVHEGRIFVGTWPNVAAALAGQDFELPDFSMIPPFPGIFMSPPIPPGGLTPSNADQWEKVWNVLEYDPDLVIAATYGLGDLISFQDHLFWGTIHVPSISFFIHSLVFEPDLLGDDCPDDPDCLSRLNEASVNSNRVTSVFRGKSFDTTPVIELLYGESSFPAFSASDGWTTMPNSSSLLPLFGPSGFFENARTNVDFEDLTNFYTWTMAVFRNQVFLGTADTGGEPPNLPGADLYRFSDLESAAVPVTIDGFGIPDVTGFRTVISDEDGEGNDDGLYLGVAARQNVSVGAGWKLLRLK